MELRILEKYISEPRINKYENISKKNNFNLTELYLINKELSESFLGVISLFEVFLRNALFSQIKNVYAPYGIYNQAFIRKLSKKSKSNLDLLIKNIDENCSIYDRLNDDVISSDLVVSRISFGFWQHLFAITGFSDLWSERSIHLIFPNIPNGISNRDFINNNKSNLEKLNILRNRICHHEIIVTYPLADYYSYMEEIIKAFGCAELSAFFKASTVNTITLLEKIDSFETII